MKRIQFLNKELNLGSKTFIMGILNATPDSFSDGGQYLNVDAALKHALLMLEQGADIIDVGGESTRPGADFVDKNTEIQRVVPIIAQLKQHTNALISVDTYKSEVAQAALERGAHIINDVWGFQKDKQMASVAASFSCLSILMHNQDEITHHSDIIDSLKAFFSKSIEMALKAGLKQDLIMLDPGIGFGKTPDQNLEILRRLHEITQWGFPVLLGTSRKSTIGKVLDLPANQRIEGTLATTALGIQSGVDIVRVHDIIENVRTAKMADAIVRGVVPWTISN